jgi:hypothetical protein
MTANEQNGSAGDHVEFHVVSFEQGGERSAILLEPYVVSIDIHDQGVMHFGIAQQWVDQYQAEITEAVASRTVYWADIGGDPDDAASDNSVLDRLLLAIRNEQTVPAD